MDKQTLLLDIASVKKQTSLRSTTSIYNKMRDEGFPKPISMGIRTKRWLAHEVEEWIQSRIQATRSTIKNPTIQK
jgi:predicted DNA-binding transcriptional regulator AlpA